MSYPSKPTGFDLRWATDVSADVVEPISGDKDVGWTDAEEPPAEYMNWLHKGAYEWVRLYLEPTTDQLITDKLEKDGSIAWTGAQKPATTNAIDIGDSTHRIRKTYAVNIDASGNIVADAMLPRVLSVTEDAGVGGDLSVTGSVQSVGFKPVDTKTASDDPGVNTLTKRLVPKAWLYIQTNGSGGLNHNEGANISSVGLASTYIDIGFARPMANAFYAVVATVDGGVIATPASPSSSKTTNYLRIGLQVATTASPANPLTGSYEISVLIFGVQ